jgi:hypothetical protein
VETFIDDVELRVALYKLDNYIDHVRVYIATDEVHPETLQKLADKGYNYSIHLVTEARAQNVTLNSAESILIDLMLMCEADVFVSYGYSTINFVAEAYRIRKL